MRKILLTLTLLLIAIQTFGKSISYPSPERKDKNEVYDRSVSTTNYSTQITFLYNNSKSEYILLNPTGYENIHYSKTSGGNYKLLNTQNIGNSNGMVKGVMSGEIIGFSARFQRLPSFTAKYNLINCNLSTCKSYALESKKIDPSGISGTKFRVDYNYVAVYDPETESWGEWKSGDNTFVININERGDIAHLKANGETVIYKKLSGVEEGYTEIGNKRYQIIKALDEDGDVFRFQLFDDTSVGLKMMWGLQIIQFAKL